MNRKVQIMKLTHVHGKMAYIRNQYLQILEG